MTMLFPRISQGARLFSVFLCVLLIGESWSPILKGAEGDENTTPKAGASLAQHLTPLLKLVRGDAEKFRFEADVELQVDSKPQRANFRLTRWDPDTFQLQAKHPDYEAVIERSKNATAMILPKHQVSFVGSGSTDQHDHLGSDGFFERTISSGCQLHPYLKLLIDLKPAESILLLSHAVDVQFGGRPNTYIIEGDVRVRFEDDLTVHRIEAAGKNWNLKLEFSTDVSSREPESSDVAAAAMTTKAIERAELERHLVRGMRRALEVLLPANQLRNPAQIPKKVEGGELRYVEGQRLVILQGTPEQIGAAHGKLLRTQAERCIDSVLYGFGTVQTIVTGRWFRSDLEEAYKRLRPHIPESHIRETRALAKSLGQDADVLETLNVFPELFHCSGFAVFGSATTDGKLYHGRVLDYMTTIGLQDCATTFIVNVDGKIPFANIGYAGFTGCVSGMNAKQISLGEMGGRGEGQWDGVPMATLMRRALEECSSLDEVIKLWSTSPRTCEYYYVFADGNTKEAVGVAATPQSIQFVKPGEGHELLGPGIEDTIALSAGSRLETLRQRINEKHGRIDLDTATWLMSRPVAMQSNLHNVLFIPEDGIFYVANADHDRPAAECKYVRYNLRELVQFP